MAKSKYRAKGPRHDASRALIEQKLRNKRNKSRREKENVGGVSLTVALAVAAAVAALVLAGGAADSLVESPNPRSDRGLGADVDITFENQYHRPVDVYLEDQYFGQLVGQQVQTGSSFTVQTQVGQRFRWTEHGTYRPLSLPMAVIQGVSGLTLTNEIVQNAKEEMKCADRFGDYCKTNAANGECDRSPGWMIVHCPRSCNACELQDHNLRCKRENLDMDPEPVWQPGDLDELFQSLPKQFPEFNPTVLSSPDNGGAWLMRFDNFIKPEEAARLIEINKQKFEKSTNQGETNEYGEMQKVMSQTRTSSNAWCQWECEDDPLVVSIYDRIANVTGVPRVNYESFQVLQYDIGQFYSVHHDDSGGDQGPAGPRILTFFLYLSDVEEGGETDFPNLGVRVAPKAGSAILWPSMKNDNPHESDPQTEHQAMPVKKGLKYAANAWIHLYNYKVPNLWGCTGSFA